MKSPQPFKLLLIGLLAAVIVFATWPYSFKDAWQSSYTYALNPKLNKSEEAMTVMNQLATNSAKPNESIMTLEGTTLPNQSKALSTRIVDYHIQVSLREDGKFLDGEQLITWTNPGKQEVTDMYVHLYPNAFKSKDTTFMQESGGRLRGDQATDQSEGYMNITSLESLEGENLLPRLKFISPDDGNLNDSSLATFRLIEAVKPNSSVTLRVKFEVKLPQVFARMGYLNDFVMAGQWFPKVAAYEVVGTRGRADEGWNIHQYHGNSEFYSNFGVYNVKIQVPKDYIVAATGLQTKETAMPDGRKMLQFYAEDVHDFSFALSPNFVTFDSTLSDQGIPGVRIQLYLDPKHEKLADRYIHAARSALSYFGQMYGTYPYSTLSIVVPPAGASGAGGMEYPTLVTALAADEDNPGYELERTVIHEIGHQYWYGMVASNEFEEAWLDEAFTSYAEEKVMEHAYGINNNHKIETRYMTNPAPLKLDAWRYNNHQHYAENVYIRGKLVLLDIEQIVGHSIMEKILRSYFQTYSFEYPSTEQFQHIVEKVTKKSWQTYFDKFVYGNETADLAIVEIQPRIITENNQKVYEYTILLEQNSGIARSIPIELTYSDGKIVTKDWEIGNNEKLHFIERSEVPLQWVQLDPKHTNYLDHRLNNNFMLAELPKENSVRFTMIATTFIDQLLRTLSW